MKNATTLPTIGAHGYFTSGSDRYPCTVTKVSASGAKIEVERDDFRVVEGSAQDGSAKYEFTRREGGATRTFTRRQDGKYRPAGDPWNLLVVGEWDAYADPHF